MRPRQRSWMIFGFAGCDVWVGRMTRCGVGCKTIFGTGQICLSIHAHYNIKIHYRTLATHADVLCIYNRGSHTFGKYAYRVSQAVVAKPLTIFVVVLCDSGSF